MDKTYRQMLDDFINEQEVDVQGLKSYRCHKHNQGFDRFAEPDDEDWDENEEWNEKCRQAIEKIKVDGLWEWTNVPDRYKEQAIKYIENQEA